MKKSFDCVEFKRRAQAALRRKYRGMTDEQIRAQRDEWIRTSDDPLAVWFRGIEATHRRQKMAALREEERLARQGAKPKKRVAASRRRKPGQVRKSR